LITPDSYFFKTRELLEHFERVKTLHEIYTYVMDEDIDAVNSPLDLR